LNRYEMVNIIDVNWGDGEPAAAQKMISEEIVKSGGSVEDIGSLGRRKLAYPINRRSEGLYLVSHFSHSPEELVPLRDSLKLNPAVIRTLLVRYGGQPGFTIREEEPEEKPAAAAGEAGPERTVTKEEKEEESQPDRSSES
jgi:small subunit ribosomal protein S6